jgi:hypothetical protein
MEAVELDLPTRRMDGVGLQEVKPSRRLYFGRLFAFTNLRGGIGANESDCVESDRIETKKDLDEELSHGPTPADGDQCLQTPRGLIGPNSAHLPHHQERRRRRKK